jgi:hypothetical protein
MEKRIIEHLKSLMLPESKIEGDKKILFNKEQIDLFIDYLESTGFFKQYFNLK